MEMMVMSVMFVVAVFGMLICGLVSTICNNDVI